MARFKVPSFKGLRLFAENPMLGDPSLPSAPIQSGLSGEFTQDMEASGALGGVRIQGGTGCVTVVNDAKDPDVEGFFDLGSPQEPAADVAEAAPALERLIQFDPACAYLVLHGLTASGKLLGEGIGRALRVGLDGTANLSVATCTALSREMRLRPATEECIHHFKTVFSLEDLKQLRPEETLALGYGATLGLSLELSGTCVGEAIAAGLESVLNRSVPLNLSVSPAASLGVTARISDGYRLFAQAGQEAGTVVFSVRKAESRVLGIDARAGLTVVLQDAVVLVNALSSAVARLTGLPGQLVDRALQRAGSDELNEKEQLMVEKAVDLLKLRDPHLGAWRVFKSALLAAEQRAREVIPRKITGSLAYTWSRITAHSHVARFRISHAALERHHADILRLDLEAVIASSRRPDGGVVFERFLGKAMRKVEIGCGFCFGVNDFVFLKGWDTRSTRYVWLRDLDGRVQVSFLGRRAYESTWMNRSESHAVELNAGMPAFGAPPPRGRDFEVGFHLSFTWKNQRLGGVVDNVIDHALVLGALHVPSVQSGVEQLSAAADVREVDGCATVSTLVRAQVAELVLAQLGGPEATLLMAHALARALPCGGFGREFAARSDVELRMRTYAPVWAAFLESHDWDLGQLGSCAARQLADVDTSLARAEQDPERHWGWSVRGVARNFGGAAVLRTAIDDLRFALSLLARRGDAGVGHSVFERAMRAGSAFWADHYGARVFGALLYLAASRQPGALRRTARKMGFSWSEPGLERAVEFRLGDELD